MAWTIQIDPILLLYIRVKPDKNSESCRPWINIGGVNKYLQTVSATLQARGTDGEIAIRRTQKGNERWIGKNKVFDEAMDDVRWNIENGHYGFATRTVVPTSDVITVTLEPRSPPSLTE